jgi:hypothetical protein
MAAIRLGSWESARAFKGIICDDISEFESHMPSHAVRSLWRFAEAVLHGWVDIERSPRSTDATDPATILPADWPGFHPVE